MCWWPVIPVGDVCVRVDSKQNVQLCGAKTWEAPPEGGECYSNGYYCSFIARFCNVVRRTR